MAPRPEPDAPAPDFTLLDAEARPVKLSDQRGKIVVLVFYRADWSPVCTNELTLLQETLDEIRRHDAVVLAVSVDGHWSHRAWARQQRITFPLLSDFWPHGEVARRYGVFRVQDGTSERALFFIDREGTLRDVWVAEDPDVAPGLNLIFDTIERLAPVPEEAPHA